MTNSRDYLKRIVVPLGLVFGSAGRNVQAILWAVSLGLSLLAEPASAQVADHLKCYKIRDTAAKAAYTANLGGLAPEFGCVIKVPAKMLCVDVADPLPGGEPSAAPAGRFLCYALKCPRGALTALTVSDQFAARSVTPSSAKMVCAPAAVGTVPTTTTTTTLPSCGPYDTCGGPCPAGQTCSANSSLEPADCQCVPGNTPCARGDFPACDGDCNSGGVCRPFATSCSCFDVCPGPCAAGSACQSIQGNTFCRRNRDGRLLCTGCS